MFYYNFIKLFLIIPPSNFEDFGKFEGHTPFLPILFFHKIIKKEPIKYIWKILFSPNFCINIFKIKHKIKI